MAARGVEIIEYEDNRVTLVLSAPADALLLLADAWHPRPGGQR